MTMRTEEVLMVKHVLAKKEAKTYPEHRVSSMEKNSQGKSRHKIGATSRKQNQEAKSTLENARKYEQFVPLP